MTMFIHAAKALGWAGSALAQSGAAIITFPQALMAVGGSVQMIYQQCRGISPTTPIPFDESVVKPIYNKMIPDSMKSPTKEKVVKFVFMSFCAVAATTATVSFARFGVMSARNCIQCLSVNKANISKTGAILTTSAASVPAAAGLSVASSQTTPSNGVLPSNSTKDSSSNSNS